MGFNVQNSDSQSQSSSEAREAVFFPSPAGIAASSDLLKDYSNRAQNFLDPYVFTGKDALNQMRLLTGMKPFDPLLGLRDRLTKAMSELTVGGDPTPQIPEFMKLYNKVIPGYDGHSSSNILYKNRFYEAYLKSGGDKMRSGKELTKFVHQPYENLSANLSRIISSDDSNVRQQSYEEVLKSFNEMIGRLGTVVDTRPKAKLLRPVAPKPGYRSVIAARFDHHVEADIQREEQAMGARDVEGDADLMAAKSLLISLRDEFIHDFSADAPRALSNEEIAQKVQQDPGYQFRFNQGLNAVESSASARGMLKSGRLGKELQQYGSGLASQQYQQTLQNYAQMAGIGLPPTQQSSGQILGVGGQLAQNIQDMNRQWFMSPWTQRSQSSSSSSSSGFGLSL